MAMRQLITFQLDDQVLGLDIMAIREIRTWSPATPLPNASPHVLGVVNLRGIVLPVLDLRQLLGWGHKEPSERHVIIVVQFATQLHGLVVEAVNDIVSIDPANLQLPPAMAAVTGRNIIEGVMTVGDDMVTVLALGSLEPEQDLLQAA